MQLGPVGGGVADVLPLAALVDFQRREIGLVAHLAAAGHPVAQIDIGQPGLSRDVDMVQNGEGAQRAALKTGVVEGIDHAEAVVEHIGQRDAGHLAPGLARPGGAGIFDDAAFDGSFLDHRGELEHIHVGHAAISMARVKVTTEEGELILGRPRAGRVAPQVGIGLEDAAVGAVRHEIGHADAGRQARRTFGAGRAIKDILATPEPLFRQRIIQPLRLIALKRGEQFPLHPPVKIRAGLRSRHIELGRYGKCVAHEVNFTSEAQVSKRHARGKFLDDPSAGGIRPLFANR